MLRASLLNCLDQLLEILCILDTLEEGQKKRLYIDQAVGQHVRHIADHLQAFLPALESGTLDYNLRRRGHLCERSLTEGRLLIEDLRNHFQLFTFEERELEVISEIDVQSFKNEAFKSTLSREVLYLINHTIHHMAYINLLAKTQDVALPPSIGLAPSTATYLRAAS